MTKLVLTLVDDTLRLTPEDSSLPVIVIANFTDASLYADGRLSVCDLLSLRNGPVVYANVVPDTQHVPAGCNDVVFFGLERQILIVSMKNVKKHVHYKISTDEKVRQTFAQFFGQDRLPVLAKHDALSIQFLNDSISVIFAERRDCKKFTDILCSRRVSVDDNYENIPVQTLQYIELAVHSTQNIKIYSPLRFGAGYVSN